MSFLQNINALRRRLLVTGRQSWRCRRPRRQRATTAPAPATTACPERCVGGFQVTTFVYFENLPAEAAAVCSRQLPQLGPSQHGPSGNCVGRSVCGAVSVCFWHIAPLLLNEMNKQYARRQAASWLQGHLQRVGDALAAAGQALHANVLLQSHALTLGIVSFQLRLYRI